MNKKKKFQEAAAIISIVLSSIFTFIFLISFAVFDRAFEIIKEQVGSQLSAEELEILKSTTKVVMIMAIAYLVAIIVVSIFAEVKTIRQERSKGLFITILVLNAIATLFSLSSSIFVALLFAVPAAFSIVVLCLKDSQPMGPIEYTETNYVRNDEINQ